MLFVRTVFTIGLLALSFSCASTATRRQALEPAVQSYNTLLRWKKFERAADYLPVEERADFIERYLAAEDDLYVESVEVRAISWLSDKPLPAAQVVVVANAYLLPSTVLEKYIIRQRWEYRGKKWLLTERSRELAPPLDPPPKAPDDNLSSGVFREG